MMKELLSKAVSGTDLTTAEVTQAMDMIMQGDATPAQIAGFITALRMKGETVEEVTGAAASMRRHATYIDAGAQTVVDTCGTGGDGANTFNISTTTAFVVAGAGISVAKHGNRAVSSQCGSADVLAALGIQIDVDPYVMEQSLQENGIGFLFAPKMHPAMKYAIGPRRELGYRTVFNMLGPLTNPAGATGQVLGVFAPELTEMFANVLNGLGTRRAFVVHGNDGLDEITCTGPTRVSELRDGIVRTYEISADMLLGDSFDIEEIAGGDPDENARILRAILDGQPGACRAVVLLNAAAAIVAGEKADRLEDGLRIAAESIDSGAAKGKLQALIDATH
ncbi:MAG: anthranilate phosphoribosyltransferase [Lentisphaerae bacterium]|nr:anthranilate phosphoribosyltransferase [Lentisphaerota bacterium]MBT5610731.1 anthranilate phosphoribosyltransferase [Lentisphaerota bacterium]MBT7054300.1 anthranilate phosphoribosyltransferase [Lentisphaerota bacterium]MBT7844361.1 anthranilate phosphoribosyltransferase [Lentisphaerota bacterium]